MLCYGYSNLDAEQKTAVSNACTTSLGGTISGSCPGGQMGCCTLDSAGYQTTECYYAGSASAYESACSSQSGVWSSGPGGPGGVDGGTTSDSGRPNSSSADASQVGPMGSCQAGQTQCPKGCVDELSDIANCGSCGYACPGLAGAQPTCQNGVCGLACAGGGQVCNGQCTDTSSDPTHCGSCNNYCQAPQGGQATCSGGQCNVGCGGETNCNGFCANLQTDRNNCGTCGNACDVSVSDGTVACTGGQCVVTCAGGEAYCGGICLDVTVDVNNCGACGNVCSGFTNECKNGTCDCQSPVIDNQQNVIACCLSTQCYINGECTSVGCLP
jgi:hypothetical protein